MVQFSSIFSQLLKIFSRSDFERAVKKHKADRAVLWLVAHQSRFDAERPERCWLERWKKSSEDKGLRALENLYPGVKMAIAALGAGLVSHPSNNTLREKLRTGRLTTQEFYRQVLRVIYRLLFLLAAEDRGFAASAGRK